MSKINVTVDDFDPLISYSNYGDWQTPDPSVNPTWYNASRDVTGSIWHEATYHLTSTPSTSLTFNSTTSSFTLYGASNGSYTLTIDPSAVQPFSRTYNGSATGDLTQVAERQVLASFDNLRWDKHEFVLQNKEGGLVVDLIVVDTAVAAQGSSTKNETIEDTSPLVTYSGKWTTQTGPNFSNGTSTYTQGGDNALAITFQGSALYLYGDSVNDHGFYEVWVDKGGRPWESGQRADAVLNDRSGCGGGWAKACEKLNNLKYFVGGLGEGNHTVALRNLGYGSYPGDPTFFDFNTAYVTIPDSYPSIPIQSGPCPFTNCTFNTASPSSGGSSSPSGSIGPSGSSSTTGRPSGTASGGAVASSSGAAGRGVMVGVGLGGGMGAEWVMGTVGLGMVFARMFGVGL